MAGTPFAQLLGTAQDGGYPHAGCSCEHCDAARAQPRLARRVASLGIVGVGGQCLMVDATPDLATQIESLGEAAGRGGASIDAIVLTHAHIGHYLGLALLGREVLNADRMPVHCTTRMAEFLQSNRPWSHLVSRNEIELSNLAPGAPLSFDGLEIHAFLVPHRAEDTDTIGITVVGPNRTLLYVPDTDYLDDSFIERVMAADVALIDGTFYSRDELRHRDMLAVKHPCVAESIPRLEGGETEVVFTHLNHTNALLHPTHAPELPSGFQVAREGQRFDL